MKRLLAASLVILAGLFLSPQPEAFFGSGDSPGFYQGGPEFPALDLNFQASQGSLDRRITFTRATAATCFNIAGVLTSFASGAPRLPCYTYDGANWINRGFLIEEARTNECLQSEALGTTWTIPGSNTTLTSFAPAAPDGNATAEDVLHDDNAETIQQTIDTITDNTVVTISAFVRQGTTGAHDFVKMSWMDESAGTNGFEAWFDLSTGAVGTAQLTGTGAFTSATMTDVSGGWFRIAAVGQIVSGQTDGRFEIINTTADAVDTAEATNSVAWWGLQIEEGEGATSYLSTTTGSVVRNKDEATMSDVTWHNANEGTFFLEFVPYLASPSATEVPLQLDANGTTNRIFFQNSSGGSGRMQFQTVNSGGNNGIITMNSSLVNNTSVKFIGAYAQDDVMAAFDTTLGTQDTAADFPLAATLLTFRIGDNSGGNQTANGYITRITYWNRSLPDGRLQDRTAFLDWWKGLMYAANDDEPFSMIWVAA